METTFPYIYDVERTICDMVQSRWNIEIQVFNTALKTYVKKKDKDLKNRISLISCRQED